VLGIAALTGREITGGDLPMLLGADGDDGA